MLRSRIIYALTLIILSQPCLLFAQREDDHELSFNRYLEVYEWNGTKHLDLIKNLSDSTIQLFISNKTIHFSTIKKVVLVKTKNPTILDIEAGASLGYTAGSMVGLATALESGSEVAFFAAPLIGLIAGAIIGGSISGKDVRNKIAIKGDIERFQDLHPLLVNYFYAEALNY